MKKCVAILLCICSFCSLSVTALAADIFDYTPDDWKAVYGVPEPQREDYEDSGLYAADWDAWNMGFSNFIIQQTQAEYARQAEEAARLAAEEEAARKTTEEQASPVETTPTTPIESAGANNGNSNSSVEDNPPAKYPIGSYVDPSGVVWSPDGTRLSPDDFQGYTPSESLAEDDPLPSGEPADSNDLPAVADPDTLSVIAGLVSDIATDPPTWYVEDLRPTDPPVTVLEGLKALVTSIFGEYTPVTTTSVVTETIGNDTHQYLVETVAPGAAGVDYEWVAGVFLFGIMLFCLMKLIGGVLK